MHLFDLPGPPRGDTGRVLVNEVPVRQPGEAPPPDQARQACWLRLSSRARAELTKQARLAPCGPPPPLLLPRSHLG